MPIGFRRELAGVRHAQLRLARDKALLEDMELDVSHGLAKAVRNLDTNFQLAQTNANRWAAAQKEVEAHGSPVSRRPSRRSNDVLEAQRRRALAQAAFWQAVTEYNKAIADLHTRKGSIMEYDGIGFEEGPWPQKAYWDALARARERDAGTYIDYGWTRPKVISRGATPPRRRDGSRADRGDARRRGDRHARADAGQQARDRGYGSEARAGGNASTPAPRDPCRQRPPWRSECDRDRDRFGKSDDRRPGTGIHRRPHLRRRNDRRAPRHRPAHSQAHESGGHAEH